MPRTPVFLPGQESRPAAPVQASLGFVEAIETEVQLGGPGVPAEPMDDLVTTEHIETPLAAPKYDRHLIPEHHVREGRGVDEQTGWRYEMWDIGMVRNATEKKMTKVFLDPIPHIVLDQHVPLRGWYQSKAEPPGVRPRPCFTDALLTQPYGGFCSVGCAFCYINAGVRGYRGQGVTVVDPTYPDKTAKQLARMRTGAAVYMSSFIDPFLEVEDYYHNTEKTARAAAAVGLPMFFLTRKQPPGWAFDLLKLNPHSYMQFSINTSNPEDWRKLSPRAVPLAQTIDNVREMSKQGIYVSIQVNPIVAGIVSNDDIVTLIQQLAEAGAKTLIFKYVEIVYSVVSGMKRQLRARFPDRADAFEALFTCNIGGFKTIDEDYRIQGLDRFKVECKKAHVDMSVCYEYTYERDAAGKILSKTGISLGPKYVTSDQCHGHRVPVYSRPSTDVLFTPIEACPPSGCLYCADDFGSAAAVPCGNPLLAAAPAWTPPMLNEPGDTVHHGGDPKKFLSKLKVLPPGV